MKNINLIIQVIFTICFLAGLECLCEPESWGRTDDSVFSLSGGPEVIYQKVSAREQDFLFAERLFDRGLEELALLNAQKIYEELKEQISKESREVASINGQNADRESSVNGSTAKNGSTAESEIAVANGSTAENDSTAQNEKTKQGVSGKAVALAKIDDELLRIGALLLRIKTEKWFAVGSSERAILEGEIQEIRSFVESGNRFFLAARSDYLKTLSTMRRTSGVFSDSAVQSDWNYSMKELWERSPFLNYLDAIANSAIKRGIIFYHEQNAAAASAIWESFLKDLQKFQPIPELPKQVLDALLYYRISALIEAAIISPADSRTKILQGILDNVPFPEQSDGVYKDLLNYQLFKDLRLLKSFEEAQKRRETILQGGAGSLMKLLMTSEQIRALSESGRGEEAAKLAAESFTAIKSSGMTKLLTGGSFDPLLRRGLEELLSAQLESILKEEGKKRSKLVNGHQSGHQSDHQNGHQSEIMELTDLLHRCGAFRRLLISGLLVEQGGSNELEKLGKDAWKSGDSDKAIEYYDRAAGQALSTGKKSDAFRLAVTAASILDEKLRKTLKAKKIFDDDSARLQKKTAFRFLDLAFRYSSEETAEELADYGLRLAEVLYANHRLAVEELIQILNRRTEAFPRSARTVEYQFRKELLYLSKNKKEKNEPFLSPENAKEFLALLTRVRAEKSDLVLLKGEEVNFYEAEAFFKTGHDQEALNRFGTLLREYPGQTEYQERIALILSRQSDPKVLEKALVFWGEVVKKSETGSPAWLRAKKNIIVIYEKTGRQDQANKMRQILRLTYPAFE